MITFRTGFQIFGIFQILFFVVFAFIIGMFISILVKSGKEKHKNDNSPRITAEATVVTKRTHVWGDHSHTNYYATFQFETGDRLELEVPHHQFGYLVENDRGKLTFQGSRFLSFERI